LSDDLRRQQERYAQALAEFKKRDARKSQASEGGLYRFCKYFWPVLEPGRQMIDGWAMEAICAHLEAVAYGEIKRLVINVPPGFSKSLICNVFFPAWLWGPMGLSHARFLAFSYAAHLTERDNAKFRDLVRSLEYQELWGEFTLVKDGEVKVQNNKTGWKFASSVGGVGTGERGDFLVVDDGHNVAEGESDAVRTSTVRWFRESISNRLNDLTEGAIIVIMQRVHELDISGEILSHPELGYTHLFVAMEYEVGRHCTTYLDDGTELWTDPRSEEGELAWPERFPESTLTPFKSLPYMWAGQYQQRPEPRGGGIIKRHYWQYYTPETQLSFGIKPDPSNRNVLRFPPFEYIVASLDSAYTQKEENDPSGFCILGVFYEPDKYMFDPEQKKNVLARGGRPNIMLISAWRKWLELHGEIVERQTNENQGQYIHRAQKNWGLIEWVAHECRKYVVDDLLIEGKASGLSVAQEMKRLYANEKFGVKVVNPQDEETPRRGGSDKVSRLWSVQHLWQDGLIWVPCGNAGTNETPDWQPKDFAQVAIDELAIYPKGYKDISDAMVYALKHLRRADFALRKQEFDIYDTDRRMLKQKLEPLYQV
jgi:phage terminase large subunit-like protein